MLSFRQTFARTIDTGRLMGVPGISDRAATSVEDGYMSSSKHLVSTDWLATRLADPDVRIVDVRCHLTWEQRHNDGPWRSGRPDYDAGHIPSAIHIDFIEELADVNDPVPLQVAPISMLQKVFGEAGLGDEHLVVAYDSDRSIFATRLWWIFRLCGHTNMRVLDGGWPKWLSEGRPVSTDAHEHEPATFSTNAPQRARATVEDVISSLGDPDVPLIDARSSGDYGGNVKWAMRGGHIPGAINIPGSDLLGADGTFLPTEDLQRIFTTAGLSNGDQVVTYCGLGLSATALAFALDMTGFGDVRVYDGSWAEWGSRDDLPYE